MKVGSFLWSFFTFFTQLFHFISCITFCVQKLAMYATLVPSLRRHSSKVFTFILVYYSLNWEDMQKTQRKECLFVSPLSVAIWNRYKHVVQTGLLQANWDLKKQFRPSYIPKMCRPFLPLVKYRIVLYCETLKISTVWYSILNHFIYFVTISHFLSLPSSPPTGTPEDSGTRVQRVHSSPAEED